MVATALVLSAGGMWAAWEVGVWKAVRDSFHPDLIVGASAGAWIGWAIAGGVDPDELIREWLDPRTADIMRFAVHRHGLFRQDVLFEKARELFERSRPRIPFALTMVELPTMKLRIVSDREITWRHLAATCAIPFCFPPVSIGDRRYVDGGMRGGLPLWAAEQLGATDALALNVLSTMEFRLLRKTLGGPRPTDALKVRKLEPSERLGSLRDAIVWSPSKIQRWVELGERDANRVLTSVRM
jgi:predicted acylesterase/phospholipase RssA